MDFSEQNYFFKITTNTPKHAKKMRRRKCAYYLKAEGDKGAKLKYRAKGKSKPKWNSPETESWTPVDCCLLTVECLRYDIIMHDDIDVP